MSARTVSTGAVMMALTGMSRGMSPATTLERRSASVTMPSPWGVSTSTEVTSSSFMSCATLRTVMSGGQNTGSRRISDVTGTVRTSGSARAACEVRSTRSRKLCAMNAAPSGRPSTATASARGSTYRAESSTARTVNSGGWPESSVGWPKSWPLVTTSTTLPLCSSSMVPSRTTYRCSPGGPFSTSTVSPRTT